MSCLCNGGTRPDPSCDGCDSLTESDNPYDKDDSWYKRQVDKGNLPKPSFYEAWYGRHDNDNDN